MPTAPVTRGKLVQRALQRANTSGYADASSEVPQLVDTSLAKMHNMLVALYEDYYLKKGTFQIVANQSVYPLPVDFMKERQVFYEDSSTFRIPLRRIPISDLTNVPISITYQAIPVGYVIYGNVMEIFPKPANSQLNKVHFFYVPEYTPALNDDSPIEAAVSFGWDEWIVNDVTIQIRNKAMIPAQELVQERAMLEATIKAQAKNRNVGDPPRVVDTGWNGTSPYNNWGNFAITK